MLITAVSLCSTGAGAGSSCGRRLGDPTAWQVFQSVCDYSDQSLPAMCISSVLCMSSLIGSHLDRTLLTPSLPPSPPLSAAFASIAVWNDCGAYGWPLGCNKLDHV
eukprot:COSAG03_NODE_1662_length_3700_cov_1.725708_1_plen_106_part_00